MSDREILLEGKRSSTSDNIATNIGVGLNNKVRMIESDKLSDNLSLFELYNKERDDCQKYRLIFTINPVCSNVLFNMKTEVVYKEGSNECRAIRDEDVSRNALGKAANSINKTDPINQIQAIRDTEFSSEDFGGFIYHCGLDIFNNHMIRNNSFTHVGFFNSLVPERFNVFNTFKDYLTDDEGNIIKENIYKSGDENKVNRHLYNSDSLLTLKNAFLYRCKEQNGWFGFVNPSNIEIYNAAVSGKKYTINRAMMNNKACEFIDLYPDRSLYSFIPKYNKYRNRAERNWDYTIMYPFENDENMLNIVCSGNEDGPGGIAFKYKKVKGKSKDLLECFCYFRHNLKVGSYVKFYYRIENGQDNYIQTTNLRVDSVGDRSGNYSNRVFNVSYDDVKKILKSNIRDNIMFYKRVVNGVECSYYFRKFKSIEATQKLSSEINKIAFGRNIYDDEIAQIVYTDDIDLTGLVDNNGRPVKDIYLAIFKRGAGRKNWYDDTFKGNNETCEFSHCFGEVTSGIDFSGMGVNKEPYDYNVHRLTNVARYLDLDTEKETFEGVTGTKLDFSFPDNNLGVIKHQNEHNTLVALGSEIINKGEDVKPNWPKFIESGITLEQVYNNPLYGDVAEMDNFYYRETILGEISHRFNTAQRESYNIQFRDILEDTILRDDFDVTTGDTQNLAMFSATTYYLNSVCGTTYVYKDPGAKGLFHGNVCPEGYFYKPFYRIPVRIEKDSEEYASAKLIKYDDDKIMPPSVEGEGTTLEIIIYPPVMYTQFKIGQTLAFYNSTTKKAVIGNIIEINKVSRYIKGLFLLSDFVKDSGVSNIDVDLFTGDTRMYNLFWSETKVPSYAKFCKERGRFAWRELVPPSEMSTNDELYNTPFMNGRFYKNVNINFFLKRQDPFGDYGLSVPRDAIAMNTISSYVLNSEVKKFDPSPAEEFINNTELCY